MAKRSKETAPSEPRYRVAHLLRDLALRTAIGNAEDEVGSLPELPKKKSGAAGSDTSDRIFYRAYLEARLERARHKMVDVSASIAMVDRKMYNVAEFPASLGRMREAVERFAALPAMSRSQLDWKKAMIGKVWLGAHDVFRDAVARDEAYLKTKAGKRTTLAD